MQIGEDTAFILPDAARWQLWLPTARSPPLLFGGQPTVFSNSFFDGTSDAANASDHGAIERVISSVLSV